jgi:hypothetical protein
MEPTYEGEPPPPQALASRDQPGPESLRLDEKSLQTVNSPEVTGAVKMGSAARGSRNAAVAKAIQWIRTIRVSFSILAAAKSVAILVRLRSRAGCIRPVAFRRPATASEASSAPNSQPSPGCRRGSPRGELTLHHRSRARLAAGSFSSSAFILVPYRTIVNEVITLTYLLNKHVNYVGF